MTLYPDHIRSYSSLSTHSLSLTDNNLLEVHLKPSEKLKIDENNLLFLTCELNSSQTTPSIQSSSYFRLMAGLFRPENYLYLPQISNCLKSFFHPRQDKDSSKLLEICNLDSEKSLNFALSPRFPGELVRFDLKELGNLSFFRPDSFLCGEDQVMVDKILFEVSGTPAKFLYFQRVHGNGWFFVKGGSCLKQVKIAEDVFLKINLKSLLGFFGDIKLLNDEKQLELDMITVKGPGTVLIQENIQKEWEKPEDLPRNCRIVIIKTSNL
jgi:uncharacterized protein (AIM24 family)